MAGDWIVVVPFSMSLTPAEAPASGPVTSAFTPEGVVPCCLVPFEVVVSGLARCHWPVVAVSVPSGVGALPLAGGGGVGAERVGRPALVGLEVVEEDGRAAAALAGGRDVEAVGRARAVGPAAHGVS